MFFIVNNNCKIITGIKNLMYGIQNLVKARS